LKAKNIYIFSLGCPKNQVDSEVMAAILERSGYGLSPRAEDAHIILINTCAFILPAKEESIDEILRMADLKNKDKGQRTYLVVTGCLPQRYGKTLEKELPEVDLFLGINEVPNIALHLDNLIDTVSISDRSIIGKPTFLMNADHPRLISTPPHIAYLKVAEGCSNSCSYCVIPSVRGKARSRKMDDIMAEAEILAARGVKEIIVTAQDTTAYGRDLKDKPTLRDLLKGLASIRGIHWIRLLYTYPLTLTDEILETIATEEKICNYIDLPVQHIDDDILKAMKRRGRSDLLKQTLEKARRIIPEVALRTSVIVGFPGETRTRFDRLLSFIRETRFEHLGVFTYSKEEGTVAATIPSRISNREKENRKRMIMEEQAVISYAINRSLIGSIQEVLIDGRSDIPEFPLVGRCKRQAPDIDGVTYVKGGNLSRGDLSLCRITTVTEYDLFAETTAN
jgi:ribosomal protein S12 methylthiotransferase